MTEQEYQSKIPDGWIKYNHLTETYDTKDGTRVSCELIDVAQCLAEVLYVAQIRSNQRGNENYEAFQNLC